MSTFAHRRAARCLRVGLLLLVGCAAPRAGQMDVAIAPDVHLVLPSPGSLGERIEVVQRLAARRGTDVLSFEGHLSVNPERLLLVGTDALGRRAMTVTWTEKEWTASVAPGVPAALRPENVLADIVLTFWPAAVVRQALRPAGAALVVEGRSRTVRRNGRDVVSITYEGGSDPWNGLTRLRNLAWGYELEIRSAVTGR